MGSGFDLYEATRHPTFLGFSEMSYTVAKEPRAYFQHSWESFVFPPGSCGREQRYFDDAFNKRFPVLQNLGNSWDNNHA